MCLHIKIEIAKLTAKVSDHLADVDGDVMLVPLSPIFLALKDMLKLVPVPHRVTLLGMLYGLRNAPNRAKKGFGGGGILIKLECLKKAVGNFLFSSGVRNFEVVSPL